MHIVGGTMSSKYSLLLLVFALIIEGGVCDQNSMFCGGWMHHTYGKGFTCCNHKLITSGVNENTHWEECAKHPNNEKENFTSSMWRVYTCVLSKSLPAKETKITFTKFTELMTVKYEAPLKKAIIDKAKSTVTAEAAKRPYLKASVSLTDHVQLDQIRAAYFHLEKTACGLKDKPKDEKWTKCDLYEEVNHREGDCCGKTPVPFFDHHLDSYEYFDGSKTCSKTLDKKLKASKLKDKEDVATFMDECNFACYLITEKLITADDFNKVTASSKIETKDIVKNFVPTYLSETVESLMQKYVKSHHKMSDIVAELPDTILGEKTKTDDILGCYAYYKIYELTKEALFKHCHPEA